MDWKFFNLPITTQTETLIPQRPLRYTATALEMSPPRPVSPMPASVTGLSSFAEAPVKRWTPPIFSAPPAAFAAVRRYPRGSTKSIEAGLGGWLDDAFAWAFVDSETKEKIEESDRKLAEINDDALARGVITPEMHDVTAQHIEDSDYESIISDPEMSVFRGFVEGAEEGLLADVAALKSATGSIFGAIPIQVYAVVGVALIALYLAKKK